MDSTKNIHIQAYNYPLPEERIAKYPLAQRDQSKLLVYDKGEIKEDTFTSLPTFLLANPALSSSPTQGSTKPF